MKYMLKSGLFVGALMVSGVPQAMAQECADGWQIEFEGRALALPQRLHAVAQEIGEGGWRQSARIFFPSTMTAPYASMARSLSQKNCKTRT